MQIQINKILGQNQLQYINYTTGLFNDWCEKLSNEFYVPARVLQVSPLLFNWFKNRFESRVVEAFLRDHQDYIMQGVVDPKHYMDLFQDYVSSPFGMDRIYPSVIIKDLKQNHYKQLNKSNSNINQ